MNNLRALQRTIEQWWSPWKDWPSSTWQDIILLELEIDLARGFPKFWSRGFISTMEIHYDEEGQSAQGNE